MKNLDTYYQNFVKEAEMFFITKFKTSQRIEKAVKDMIDILFNVTETVDCERGILAYNPQYGQGKTFLFKVMNHWHRRIRGRNLFVMTSAVELAEIYTNGGKEALNKKIDCRNLFIDDIGAEGNNKYFKYYSDSLNVINYVIMRRYEQWTDHEWKTYGTTNLTDEQFAKEYGGRPADRAKQMFHRLDFKFLKDGGSFRQHNDTRKLTKEEIAISWAKFEKPKEVERVNIEEYLNGLIAETDEYLDRQDTSFWTYIKDYLLIKGLLTEKDFDQIDEEFLDRSRSLHKRNVRKFTQMSFSNATGSVRNAAIDQALANITRKQVYDVAENIIAKRRFMQLRTSKHIFQ